MSTERKKANEVLLQSWRGKGLPIDPAAIARSLGVVVEGTYFAFEEGDAEGVSGQYLRKPVPTIKYEMTDSSNRRRFTVAHELGHHVMEHGDSFRDTSKSFQSTALNLHEVSANRFAAELLMPAKVVTRLVVDEGETDIVALAKRFGVSEVAMRYRLINLGLL